MQKTNTVLNYVNTSLEIKNSLSDDYQNIFDQSLALLKELHLSGDVFRTAVFWKNIIPVTDKPIRYLEIGAYHGMNAISFCEIYGKNDLSEIHCIDPWIDYNTYYEYEGKQDTNYKSFCSNLEIYKTRTQTNKFKIHRNYSHEQLIKFPDNYFDIIYIDGNHESNHVLEDAVLSFRKLKQNGYLIFDDIAWETTNTGICSFLMAYEKFIKILTYRNQQLFVMKTNDTVPDVIVACYNENLNWIYDNNLQNRSFVYFKNPNRFNEFDCLKHKEILTNVGRESHTYLYHIIKNYDNLSDIMIFTQGHPFDHASNFTETIQNYKNIDKFTQIGNRKIVVNNFICKYHDNIPIEKCCKELFVNPPTQFEFTPGGIFAVDKQTVLKRSKKFYENCMKYLDYHINPNEGFVFERIWNIIFNPDIKSFI